jgi:hypothetical protein
LQLLTIGDLRFQCDWFSFSLDIFAHFTLDLQPSGIEQFCWWWFDKFTDLFVRVFTVGFKLDLQFLEQQWLNR